RDNAVTVAARPGMLKIDAWNHLAMTYDGDVLRFFVNGAAAGEQRIGRPRTPGRAGLAFGRRQDNCGDGYHFRGAIDEVRIHDRALTAAEIHGRFVAPEAANPALKPVRAWSFRAGGRAATEQPRAAWRAASMEVRLAAAGRTWRGAWAPAAGGEWSGDAWREAAAVVTADALRPGVPAESVPCPSVSVHASEFPGGAPRPVEFDAARGWHRVSLDGIEPVVPAGDGERRNDAMERVRLVLKNPADAEQVTRLLFEKTSHGIRQRIGAAITGVSAVLRDADGHPTGLPVQLSKNWHTRAEGGVYAGQWFHGFSQVRLPPRSEVPLELTVVYGHWGGVAAASHAQLCLIGWGSNQQWDQSALGSWGESICYEPDQAQARCAVLDVRPVMVRSMSGGQPWTWTHNVGGGDFVRLFDPEGRRVMPGRMRTAFLAQGPCLTEVVYAGRTGGGIEQSAAVSLARTDDLVRGTYRLRLDAAAPVSFSRFVIFQIGADTYSYTGERKMAVGDGGGLRREWPTQWGGDTNRTAPVELGGRAPWISLHEAGDVFRTRSGAASPGPGGRAGRVEGAWASRGIVIREWKARLGGREAAPWMLERGVSVRGADTSTADIVPPPGVERLEPGDFVEATFEHIIVPQRAEDYYGPNEALRAALARDGDTWRMIHREAAGNDRRVTVSRGRLERTYPDIRVRADGDAAEFTLAGGIGYVPVTVTGLSSPRGQGLLIDGRPVDQAVHGNDFWQTGYDSTVCRWSRTWTIPSGDGRVRAVRLGSRPENCTTTLHAAGGLLR
ncbi:MAG: LamG domain-containing protein, partial [Lentisphaerae bacterium]|nr:LamG domain-containing protein [Lentisphaerota bacterium]